MSIYPTQNRTVDPFADYNSNTVNQLSKIISYDRNCIHHVSAIDVSIDSTNPDTNVIVGTGKCLKDNVFIEFTEELNVDLEDSLFYINGSAPFNEAGYYYLCLNYTYQKSRPAPRASIRILKPSERSALSQPGYMFLKCIYVIFNGANFEISDLYDYDPSDISIKREFIETWAGQVPFVPEYDTDSEGKIIYVKDKKELFFGSDGIWESFGGIRAPANTQNCLKGQLSFLDLDGNVYPAIASDSTSYCDSVVLREGTISDNTGKVRLYGYVDYVLVESGITVNPGDELFLSGIEAGTVTNMPALTYTQIVGKCVSNVPTDTTCEMWFMPKIDTGGSSLEEFQIRTFIGKNFAGSEMPTYSSTNHIVQNSDLETAIGALDSVVGTTAEEGYLRSYTGKASAGNVMPVYTSVSFLNQSASLLSSLSRLDQYIGFYNSTYTIPSGTTTPSTKDGSSKERGIFITGNAGSTTITNFTGATRTGSIIIILFNDNNTTIQNNAGMMIQGGIDFLGNTGDSMVLSWNGTKWIEISRSLNS